MIDIDTSREAVERLSADILRGNASTHRAAATLRALLAERDEIQATFDLRWQADMRAMKQWQAAHPGNELVWPDHADMVVWLLDQRDAALRDLAAARKALRLVLPLAEAWADGKSRSHPDHECIDAARAALAAQPVSEGERA